MGNMISSTSIAYPYSSSRQFVDQRGRTFELPDAPTVISQQQFSQLFESNQTADWERWSRPARRVIDKVSPQLRMKEDRPNNKGSVYDPTMVSLGPYHHGNSKLQQAKEFKFLSLDLCCEGNDRLKKSAYENILGSINRIRECYNEDELLKKYDDKQLALMMLLDSCFILNFMETLAKTRRNNRPNSRTQAAADPFMARDILVLENQIPYFVLKILISTLYDGAGSMHLLQQFFNWILHDSLDEEVENMFRDEQNLPLHILEACWRLITANQSRPEQRQVTTPASSRNQHTVSINYRHTESARELKSKGIHFSSTSTCLLSEIKFESGLMYGQLKLPACYVSIQTQVMLSNMIAYELWPNTPNKLIVLSYSQFMKSLIQTPEDVKVLQKKGVFHRNAFANPKQVVKFYQDVNTLGMGNSDVYEKVMDKLGQHSNKRANTWLAEVVHDYLSSPWTIIGLLTAIVLLVLTVLQTYYTMYPMDN